MILTGMNFVRMKGITLDLMILFVQFVIMTVKYCCMSLSYLLYDIKTYYLLITIPYCLVIRPVFSLLLKYSSFNDVVVKGNA